MKKAQKRGFTLIELLVVIAILAVLATTVVLVLNPAQLLKQGRDATRISDLAALNSAIALYLADVSSPNLGITSGCPSGAGGGYRCTATSTPTNPFQGTHTGACTYVTSTSVTGSGWVDVNFSQISSGSPLPKLPLDPSNDTAACGPAGATKCMYAYACTGTSAYEINAYMESTKYNTGNDAVVGDDGGDNTNAYEVGSGLTQ